MGVLDDDMIRALLRSTEVIACVGVSANPVRPSHYVARYLKLKGFRVIPVNPGLAGHQLFGEDVAASLADLRQTERGQAIDMVDIFRRPEHVPEIVEAALQSLPNLRTIWMQIGVVHERAAEKAQAAGKTVVMDRCPKIEYQRLFGELRMGGFATGVISSRL
ncbi:MAG: CoA-binding protein [Pseudomonadota bacterium]